MPQRARDLSSHCMGEQSPGAGTEVSGPHLPREEMAGRLVTVWAGLSSGKESPCLVNCWTAHFLQLPGIWKAHLTDLGFRMSLRS